VAVTLTRAFEIQQHELTQAAWLTLVLTNPSGSQSNGVDDCQQPECPLGNVSWVEALQFANLLSASKEPPLPPCYELTGCTGTVGKGLTCSGFTVTAPSVYECAGYRLPTDAEWEYAARAGTTTSFYSGLITRHDAVLECNVDEALDRIGWYCKNSGGTTHPVGLKQANAWGLYDMSGNAAEFVSDEWTGRSDRQALTDPGGTLGTNDLRTQRSCFATASSWPCRSAMHLPTSAAGRGPGLGLRLVLEGTQQLLTRNRLREDLVNSVLG
jgi:formylglycine-generating enzyme required for sulfatase activity